MKRRNSTHFPTGIAVLPYGNPVMKAVGLININTKECKDDRHLYYTLIIIFISFPLKPGCSDFFPKDSAILQRKFGINVTR